MQQKNKSIEFWGIKFDMVSFYGIMLLSLPLSIKVFFEPANTQIIYPGEIFIGILFIFSLVIISSEPKRYFQSAKFFLTHPISILIVLYLTVNVLSLLFSTLFLVSIKAVLVKICYVGVFYFMMHSITKGLLSSYSGMQLLYSFSLVFVCIYAFVMHNQYGISRGTAAFMPLPFFNDHTIFSASIVFLIPIVVGILVLYKEFNFTSLQITIGIIGVLVLIISAFFSFSRAAWISIVVSFILFLLVLLRIRFKGILLLMSITAVTIFFARDLFLDAFSKNKFDSNRENAGVYEQIFSVTNLSNDESNLERLNRWKSAVRMFYDRPLLGFGPGTYQFKYIAYQKKDDMGYISLEEPLPFTTSYHWTPGSGLVLPKEIDFLRGKGGTAHSEYLLALSETGILGFLVFIGLYVASMHAALKIYFGKYSRPLRILSLCILLSLTTYIVHSLFNNFLDDCKLAFLFFGSLSALAAFSSVKSDDTPEQNLEL
jgi:putative inorganic carbon (hco3(-)) transporter